MPFPIALRMFFWVWMGKYKFINYLKGLSCIYPTTIIGISVVFYDLIVEGGPPFFWGVGLGSIWIYTFFRRALPIYAYYYYYTYNNNNNNIIGIRVYREYRVRENKTVPKPEKSMLNLTQMSLCVHPSAKQYTLKPQKAWTKIYKLFSNQPTSQVRRLHTSTLLYMAVMF